MSPTVTDNPERERYELRLGDELAGVLEYRGRGPDRALTHTEVFEGHEGQGLAKLLVGGALDDLRDHDLKIVPVCPYVKQFVQKHPEYLELIEPKLRAGLGLASTDASR